MLPLKVWQQDKEKTRKANMSHFISPALNSGDTLIVPSSTWSALIEVVSHRSRLCMTEKKKPDQQGTLEICNMKAHEVEEMNME